MKMRILCFKFVLAVSLCIGFSIDGLACTSAVISAKASSDGRPLLWKNRDTDELDNRIQSFKGAKYDFIAIVNSRNVKGDEAWAGNNVAGFCIMNTASYNLREAGDTTKLKDMEGVLMYKALSICRNLKDFENLLDTLPKPLGVEANFGVIDAEGGAAYYEVNDFEWEKRDANDPDTAPNGYLIVTNFSFSGRTDEGSGYIRYETASKLFEDHLYESTTFTPRWLLASCSRSFYNSLLDIDLCKQAPANGWFPDSDFIPRRITSAAVVFQGVRAGENPALTVMWTILGYPPVSCAVPLFAGTELPVYMTSNRRNMTDEEPDSRYPLSYLDVWSMERKAKVFSVTRGNGGKYLNFSVLYNKKGTGLMQESLAKESKVFNLADSRISVWRSVGKIDQKQLSELYSSVADIIFL